MDDSTSNPERLAAAPASAGGLATPASPSSLTADLRAARVAVMSTPACPYCKRAKEALAGAGVGFVDVDVGHDEALRQAVRDITGKRTVPQIFVGGRGVGGCDDLLGLIADGRLDRLLAEAEAEATAGTGQREATAVPPALLAAVEAARRRAAEAGGRDAGSAASTSAPSGAPQRLRDLAARMRQQGGIPRAERKIGSRSLSVFTAHQLAEWLAAAGEADPAATAAELLAHNLITPAVAERAEAERVAARAVAAVKTAVAAVAAGGEEVVLALVAEMPLPVAGEALNGRYWWQGPARPADEVASGLRQLILELYDKHLSADGRSVSYGAMRADPLFATFTDATAELQKVDLSPLSREELMSFAINLYNALIIHALVGLGLTRMSTAQRASFYNRVAKYNIGGLDYTADDLEQGVLRGNRAGASNIWNLLGLHFLAGGHFGGNDPKLAKVVTPMDPRIHFALVCGAKSCPPIKLYSAANLEEGLAAAAEAFCAGEVEVDRARREVRLSKIFKWYAVDFGSNKLERLAYLGRFLAEPARDDLLALLREAKSGGSDVRVSYKEYDWSLNGTD